jgi:K+-transporting ATPase KdpF subunit
VSVLDIVGLLVAVGLLAYLAYALLRAEEL